jgi:hypothetical protein
MIMEPNEISEVDVQSYIDGANVLLTRLLGTKGLGEDLLTEIERWLTAHLIVSSRERMAKKEGAGGAFIEYAGNYGENLMSTSYGQVAVSMDVTGGLATLGMKRMFIKAVKS